MCWWTDCWRSPKAFPWLRQPLLAVPALRELEKCLQGEFFVRCCHSTYRLLVRASPGVAREAQQPSAAVCDPDPPCPFARYRKKSTARDKNQGAAKAKGGVIKGGVYKRKQTQISGTLKLSKGPQNADKRANAGKREQTQNQRITPPFTHPLLRQPKKGQAVTNREKTLMQRIRPI